MQGFLRHKHICRLCREIQVLFLKLFACLLVFVFQVKGRIFFTNAGMQMSCSEFVSPDALLDLRFCG